MRIDHRNNSNNTNVIVQLRSINFEHHRSIRDILYRESHTLVNKNKETGEKKYEVDVRNSATCGICMTVVKIRSDRCETREASALYFSISRDRCVALTSRGGSCAVPVVEHLRVIRERMSLDACPPRDSDDVVALTNCIALSHRSYVPFPS